jgi:hypothetical protein
VTRKLYRTESGVLVEQDGPRVAVHDEACNFVGYKIRAYRVNAAGKRGGFHGKLWLHKLTAVN